MLRIIRVMLLICLVFIAQAAAQRTTQDRLVRGPCTLKVDENGQITYSGCTFSPPFGGGTLTGSGNNVAIWTGTNTLGGQNVLTATNTGGVNIFAGLSSFSSPFFVTAFTPNNINNPSFSWNATTTNANAHLMGIRGNNLMAATADILQVRAGPSGTDGSLKVKGNGQVVLTSNISDDSNLTFTNLTNLSAPTSGAAYLGVNAAGKVVVAPTPAAGLTGSGTNNFLMRWSGSNTITSNPYIYADDFFTVWFAGTGGLAFTAPYMQTINTPSASNGSFTYSTGATTAVGNLFNIIGANKMPSNLDLFRVRSGPGGNDGRFQIKGDGQINLTSGVAGDSGLTFINMTNATAPTSGAAYAGINAAGKVVIAPTPSPSAITSVINGGNGFGQYVAVFDASSPTGSILRSSPIWVNDPDEIRFFQGGTFGGYKATFDRANIRTKFENLTTTSRYFDLQLGTANRFDVALPTGNIALGDVNGVGAGNKITISDSGGTVEMAASTDAHVYAPNITLAGPGGAQTAGVVVGGILALTGRIILPTLAGNQCTGTGTMAAGTATITTTCAATTSTVIITRKGTPLAVGLAATANAGSITVTSTNVLDTGQFYYLITN